MAESIVVWDCENASMGGGSWRDEIVCTRRKDGSFSLLAQKRGEDGVRKGTSKVGIDSPDAFIEALVEAADSLDCDFDAEAVSQTIVERLDALDANFARRATAFMSARSET